MCKPDKDLNTGLGGGNEVPPSAEELLETDG